MPGRLSGSRSTPTSSRSPSILRARARSAHLGSAMAAAIAAGIYPDFDSAAQAMVAIERVVEPDPGERGRLRRSLRTLRRRYIGGSILRSGTPEGDGAGVIGGGQCLSVGAERHGVDASLAVGQAE